MKHFGTHVQDVKIAYIGGGSRGWAWGLMSDLAACDKLNGEVRLYDIDKEAAKNNEIIGNKMSNVEGCVSHWRYLATESIDAALTGADFVVISILPGTFDEMESDVHTPEKYGIYQSVGDTSGPGGIIRALRTIPMYEEIAAAIRDFCPDAWVINYTNPMTVCVDTLYRVFPKIKAFGCCHEVFGTQKLLCSMITDKTGINDISRDEIKVNVLGVNHFTWLTQATYHDIDIFSMYQDFVAQYKETGYLKGKDDNWMNNSFSSSDKVKFALFDQFGWIAAAGDRHLAEFCPGNWFLKNPDLVKQWGFGLTPVSWRKEDLTERLQKSADYISGAKPLSLNATGEDGVKQMCALLGLGDLVTNVNLPNVGQIPNLPLGAVVETNAVFTSDCVTPVLAGNIPDSIYPLISPICGEQRLITQAGLKRDLNLAFQAFVLDPLVTLSLSDSKALFDEMVRNTASYLQGYSKISDYLKH